MTAEDGLESRCDLLRSLHRPGFPLVLPNAWDAATAKAVAAAGFPAVATTSAGVAAALGYEDHERAPAGEMLAAAARITRSVGVPVTVDAEAGYGMTAAELVAELKGMGAEGCNLEDSDHAAQTLRDPVQQAAWLRDVRQAAAGAAPECSSTVATLPRVRRRLTSRRIAIPHSRAAMSPSPRKPCGRCQTATKVSWTASATRSRSLHRRASRIASQPAWRSYSVRKAPMSRSATARSSVASPGPLSMT